MTPKRDFYEILGVDRDADGAEIKRAFRQLARECHPDVNPDDAQAEGRFKEGAEAYEVLSDPAKRAAYDRHGRDGLRGFPMPDFEHTPFDRLFDAYFGPSVLGVPQHPYAAMRIAYALRRAAEEDARASRADEA